MPSDDRHPQTMASASRGGSAGASAVTGAGDTKTVAVTAATAATTASKHNEATHPAPAPGAVQPILHAPPALDAVLRADATVNLATVLRYLPLCVKLCDLERAAQYTRQLHDHLDDDLPISAAERVTLFHVYEQLVAIDAHDTFRRGRWYQTMSRLLTSSGRAPDRTLPGLVVAWRPLYDALVQTHYHGPRGNYLSHEWLQHAQGLVNLVVNARRYFPAGTAKEMLQLTRPYLCPHDSVYYRTQALLGLFLPTHAAHTTAGTADHAADIPQWLDTIMQAHSWKDRVVHSHESLFALLSRAAKHSLVGGHVAWHRYMPDLFNHFLQLLDLNVAGANPYGSIAWPPNIQFLRTTLRVPASFAKLVVYTLYPGSPTLSLLQQLLMTVATFFHPSNTGRWSADLGSFLSELAGWYAKRAGAERRGELRTPKARALDQCDTAFAKALLPVAMQALYSKGNGLVSAAQSVLRHMSYALAPSLVLGPVVRQCYAALQQTTSSHRTMSMLSALSQFAAPLVHRTRNPSGAAHVEQLLWLTLPGLDPVDPVKTGHTAMWLATLFQSVPFIDARDPNLFTSPAQARAAAAQTGTPAVVTDLKRLAASVSDDPSRALALAPTDDDNESEARAATLRFEEWSLAFVRQIITVLSVQDKFAEQNYGDHAFLHYLKQTSRAFFSAASPAIFVKCADVIIKHVLSEHNPNTQKHFGALCATAATANPTLFLALALPRFFKKLLTTVTAADPPRAGQAVGDVVLASFGDSELEWYLYLLSQVVKQSSSYGALLPYTPQLFAVYRASQRPPHSHKKDIQKMGNRVLRSALRSLVRIYPAEYRPFPARYYASGWKHWQSWATYGTTFDVAHATTEPDNLEIDWHIPTDQELAAATKLAADALAEPLKLLVDVLHAPIPPKAAADAKDTKADAKVDTKADVKMADAKATGEKKAKGASASASATAEDDRDDTAEEKLVLALKQVLQVARGIHGVMGALDGAPVYGKPPAAAAATTSTAAAAAADDKSADAAGDAYEASAERDEALSTEDPTAAWKAFDGKRVPLVRPTHSRLLKDLEFTGLPALPGADPAERPVSVRTYLARLCHQLLERTLAQAPTQHNLKALCILIKLARHVTTADGVLENKLSSVAYTNRSTRKWQAEHATGLRCTLRPLMVERAHYLHQRRVLALCYNSTYTADVRALVADLQRLAVHDFSKIRGKALLVLVGVLNRFPLGVDLALDNTLAVIRRSDSKDEPLIGALTLLAQAQFVSWATRRWRRLAPLLLTLCQSASQFSDDKTQLAVQNLFTTLFQSVAALPVRLPTPTSAAVSLQSLPAAAAAAAAKATVDSPVPITPAHIEARERSIAGYARSLEAHYHRLMRELLTIVNQGLETNKLLDAKLASEPKAAAAPAPHTAPLAAAAQAAAGKLDATKVEAAVTAVAKAHPNNLSAPVAAQLVAAVGCGDFAALGKLAATLKPEVAQALMKAVAAAGVDLKGAATAAAAAAAGTGAGAGAKAKGEEKDSTPLHWKYHLMASACLFALCGNDTPAVRGSGSGSEMVTTEDLVTYFAKGLVSDLHPLREISMIALVKLLDGHTNALRPASAAESVGAADGGSATELFRGWVPADPNTKPGDGVRFVGRTATRALAPSAVQTLTTLLSTPGALRKILDTLQHNHPTLHPPTIQGSRTHGAGDVIAALTVRRYVRSFPYSAAQLSSNAFNTLHARLVRNLVQTVPGLLTASPRSKSLLPIAPLPTAAAKTAPAADSAAAAAAAADADGSKAALAAEHKAVDDSPSLIDQLMRLCGDVHEQETQCTAVEVFAGLSRALKHNPQSDPTVRAAMQAAFDTRVLPLVRAALAACQPDCVGHWKDALRYALFNQLPEAVVNFQQLLQSATFPDANPTATVTSPAAAASSSAAAAAGTAVPWSVSLSDESPAGQSKRLRFLQTYLTEQAWHTNAFGRAVLRALSPAFDAAAYNAKGLDGLASLLHSPFSIVRDEVARTLSAITRNFFTLSGAADAKSSASSGGAAAADAKGQEPEASFPFTPSATPELDAFLAYYQQLLPIPKRTGNASGNGNGNGAKTAEAAAAAALTAPSDAEKAEEKRRQNALETVLTWVITTLYSGDHVWAGRVAHAFLPAILHATHHPDKECAAVAKYTAGLCSWTPVRTRTQVAATLASVEQVLRDADSWHVRVAGLQFLLVFVPRQSLLVSGAQVRRLHTVVSGLLRDAQVEVREAAKQTLASLLLSTSVHDHAKAAADARAARDAAVAAGTFNPTAAIAETGASGADGDAKQHFNGGDDESLGAAGDESDPRFPLGEYDTANRVRAAYADTVHTLLNEFRALANTKLPKVAKPSAAAPDDGAGAAAPTAAASAALAADSAAFVAALTKRHAGVLGLSSVVSMHPYDVPRYLPAVLSTLTTHLNDPAAIATPLRKLLADWRRTIADTWHEVKDKFSAAELDALEGASVAPSYFA